MPCLATKLISFMQAASLKQSLAHGVRFLFLLALILNNLRNVSFRGGIARKDIFSNAEQFILTYPPNQFSIPDWMDDLLQNQPVVNHSAIFEDPNSKYIILACHYYNCWKGQDACEREACGGITDRMWQIPYYLWLAHQTGRYFLIRFSKPHPLERFYSPPRGGFDWRLPAGTFIDDEFERYGNRSFTEMRNQRRMQWHQHIYKDEWRDKRVIFANTNLAPLDTVKVAGFKETDVIPGMFRRMFEPIPFISKKIDAIAKEHNLTPGNYAGVHIRARFPVSNQLKLKSRKRNADMSGGGFLMEDRDTFNLVSNMHG